MIKKFFKHVHILITSIFLDKNEIFFINSCTKTKSDLKKNIGIKNLY